MNIKVNKKTLHEAINQGCKTVTDLAYFIKIRSLLSMSLPTH